MGTFDDLGVGARIDAPRRTIGAEATEIVTGFGGYTHPLFTDPEYVRRASPFDRTPLPGALVLFLMGGMAEQTGIFDETTIALVGLDEVRFGKPIHPGDSIGMSLEVIGKRRSESGRRGSLRFRWRCTDKSGDEVATATAELLFRLDGS